MIGLNLFLVLLLIIFVVEQFFFFFLLVYFVLDFRPIKFFYGHLNEKNVRVTNFFINC